MGSPHPPNGSLILVVAHILAHSTTPLHPHIMPLHITQHAYSVICAVNHAASEHVNHK